MRPRQFNAQGSGTAFGTGFEINRGESGGIQGNASLKATEHLLREPRLFPKEISRFSEQLAVIVVGAPGFGPGTSCAQGRRATRLRYAPTFRQETNGKTVSVTHVPQPLHHT
jgi:hypothetical protein